MCSYLQFYKYKKEGHGVSVKSYPTVDKRFLRRVEEYNPDKIFVLDLANIHEEFMEKVKVPIIWIDHHGPFDPGKALYFNPRNNGNESIPVTALCYHVLRQDLWLAVIGSFGDWYYPDFAEEFSKLYPDILPPGMTDPETVLFETEMKTLVRIFSFMLMGKSNDAMKYAIAMGRIEGPRELLNKETPRAKFILKKYDEINKEFTSLLQQAKAVDATGKLVLYSYANPKYSLSKDIANELSHLYPDKVIVVGRVDKGEVKMSLRSRHHDLPKIIDFALVGLTGYGGGHEYAAGACVKEDDFSRFLERMKEKL